MSFRYIFFTSWMLLVVFVDAFFTQKADIQNTVFLPVSLHTSLKIVKIKKTKTQKNMKKYSYSNIIKLYLNQQNKLPCGHGTSVSPSGC